MPDDLALMIEARSLVYETTGIPIDAQLSYSNREWVVMYEIAMKRYKQKLELSQINSNY